METSMNLKRMFLAALAVLTLASCSKEEVGQDPTAAEGVETLMSMSINRLKANSRAHYGDLDVTSEESTIEEVTVYIFNALGILEEVVDFDANTSTKTFKVTTGDKTFLAAANIPSLPTFTKGVTNLTTIKNAELSVANIAVAATDDQFWMTSLSDNTTATLVEITDPAYVPSSANDITIPVGRAVAKVGVYFNPTTQPGDGSLSGVKYKMHNNPVKMRLFTSNDAAGNRITPFYSATYAAANYFNNATYLATGVTFDAVLNKNLHDYPSYMTENSNLSPTKGNATLVMIKGVYTPGDVLDPATGATDAAWSSGDDFWRIANLDGSGNVISYEPEYYSVDPTTDLVIIAPQRVDKYTGGEAYYGLWLNDATQTNTVDRYTIKRNQYWSVEVTSVSGCGAPDEGGVIVEPGEELDADTYMKATISVEAWDDVEHPGGI